MKTIDPDDPRITAYAIGELDAADLAEVEALLEGSPEARAEVEAVRETCALLEKELGDSGEQGFSDEEREEVLAAGKTVTPGPDAFSRFSGRLGTIGVAACLLAVGTFGAKQLIQQDKAEFEQALESGESALPAAVTTPAATPRGAEKGSGTLHEQPPGDSPFAVNSQVGGTDLKTDAERLAEPKPRPDALDAASLPPEERMLSRAQAAASEEGRDGLALGRVAQPAPKPEPASPIARPETEPGAKRVEYDAVPAEPPVAATPVPAAADPFRAGAVAGGSTDDPFGGADVAFGEGTPGNAGAVRQREAKRVVGDAAPVELAKKFALAGKGENAESLARRMPTPLPEPIPGGPTPPRTRAGGEDYQTLSDTPFVRALDDPLSTFAIDVDTGSYSNVRRYIGRRGQLPPKDAVRVEEMINYFDYGYAEPEGEHPFAIGVDVASCPWAVDHRLVRVSLKGRSMAADKRPPSTLVFLVDVSGSMRSWDKLDLLKQSLVSLVKALNEDDSIAIVTYAGQAQVAMEPRHGDDREAIIAAINALRAGGSTNGGDGIKLAYELAKAHFVEGGTNRVVLATDGDFNVGTTNTDALIEAVKGYATRDKIGLTVLGFGEGNLKEQRMEQIANKGDGNYFYIDCLREGRRVLVDKLSATLVTIAKDVKVQVDFNPAKVHSYRLIGYANRRMPDQDFRDDTKDAGEIGAGHTVTALYEVVPVGAERPERVVAQPKSRYIEEAVEVEEAPAPEPKLVGGHELLTAVLRYKAPDAGLEDPATEFERPLTDGGQRWAEADDDFRFAAAVAAFGMQLRESPYKGAVNCDLVLELAGESLGEDPNGLRAEFVDLVNRAKSLEPLRRIRD